MMAEASTQPGSDAGAATAADATEELRQIAFLNFANRLTARRVGQSYVIEIAYSSSDPALAARVANAAASAYLLQSVEFKADAAASGAEFLQGRAQFPVHPGPGRLRGREIGHASGRPDTRRRRPHHRCCAATARPLRPPLEVSSSPLAESWA